MANLTTCVSCDNGCQRCNSCQSDCYTCNKCNSCQSCNLKCQVTCNSTQRICETSTNVLSSYCGNTFSWGKCTTGQTMGPGYFDKSTWDQICSFINRRASIGSKVSGGSSFATSRTENVAPFKASEFNRVADELGATTHNQNDVIYGSYFDNLASAANNYRFSSSACSNCNTECQGCNACQKCNQSNTDACGASQLCTSCNACLSSNTKTECCKCDTSCDTGQNSGGGSSSS